MANPGAISAGCLLAAAGCAVLCAAGGDADPAEVLKRVGARVHTTTERRLPNCTCVETVTREAFLPATAAPRRTCSEVLAQRQHPPASLALHSYSLDRLRLDVAMTEKGEIFSWAGARQFSSGHIGDVVGAGPIGTGAFGGFLQMIFEIENPGFTFVRNLVAGHRALMEFRYAVSAEASTYAVRLHRAPSDTWMNTAYAGAIQVDPATAEIVRLTVETAELPPDTGLCMSTAALDYAPVEIGDYRVPLPVRMRQRFVAPNGQEAENTTVFTACREFKGESMLSFGADPGVPPLTPAPTPPAPVPPLPPGLPFAFVLTAPIHTDTAAAGDRFAAKLAEPLRDDAGTVLAPAGAAVEGRLLSVECFRRPPYAVVVLRPESLEMQGVRTPLAARLDLGRALAERRRGPGTLGLQISLPQRREEGSGVFRFPGQHVSAPRGFRSDWQTLEVQR